MKLFSFDQFVIHIIMDTGVGLKILWKGLHMQLNEYWHRIRGFQYLTIIMFFERFKNILENQNF